PVFEWDDNRIRARDQLLVALKAESKDQYSRTVWMIGPPGVGKTRLALETLRGEEASRQRTLVAISLDDARAALRDHALHKIHPEAVLVVDDCPPNGIHELLPWLHEHNRHGRGGLLVLTPLSPDAQAARPLPGISRLDITAMDSSAARRLIARELDEAEDT